MAKFFDAKLEGNLVEGLDKLAAAAGESTLRATGYAGAQVFQEEAIHIHRASVKTGTIQKNIIVKRLEEESDGAHKQTYIVTVRKGKMNKDGDAFYWKWVEGGHKFVPRRPKGTPWKAHRTAAELEYGKSTVPAKPFIRPSYEAKKEQAIKAMLARMAGKIKEYLG